MLYFYPKDDTPGCSYEECDFRDNSKVFVKIDTVFVGVRPDSVESHVKFKRNTGCRFSCSATRQKNARGVRRVERKKHVWPEVHGRGAQHVRD